VRVWDLRAPGCQREYGSRAAVNSVCLHPNQGELISGDQTGHIRVWDLTANACSCELVPEVGTAGAFYFGFLVFGFLVLRLRALGVVLLVLVVVRPHAAPERKQLRARPLLALTQQLTIQPPAKNNIKNRTSKLKTPNLEKTRPNETVRSLTVAPDGSMMVAANNSGTCYVWRMLRGAAQSGATHFEPLHKLRAHHGEFFGVDWIGFLSFSFRRRRARANETSTKRPPPSSFLLTSPSSSPSTPKNNDKRTNNTPNKHKQKRLHHALPHFAGRAAARDRVERPHRQALEPGRVRARAHARGPHAVGVGLRVQRR
jgi:WD40 repeat protein